MTNEEAKLDTQKHIDNVGLAMDEVIARLQYRAKHHDASKLEEPEVSVFNEFTERLKTRTYGSPEYEKDLAEMKSTLEHHYARNRHHPEHHARGIDDMNIIDLVEMLCDWKSATLRHNDGNLNKSIEYNADKFDMAPQLKRIFQNSVEMFYEVEFKK